MFVSTYNYMQLKKIADVCLLALCCRAARQEMSILVTVSHPNIVPIIGFCLNPLSLILPLAPIGSLDVLLMEYRKHGCYLNTFMIKHIIAQVEIQY